MSLHMMLLVALAVPSTLAALGKITRELYTILTVRHLSADCDPGQCAAISAQLVETLRSGTNHELVAELVKKRTPAAETQS